MHVRQLPEMAGLSVVGGGLGRWQIVVGQRARKMRERPRRGRKEHGILCTDYDMTGAETGLEDSGSQ